MLTIMFRMTAFPGREDEAARTCRELMTSSRKDDGCITYTMYRRSGNPLEFLLFEEWRDQAALDAHLARLRQVYGPADEQASELPRRRIPKQLSHRSSEWKLFATKRLRDDRCPPPCPARRRARLPPLPAEDACARGAAYTQHSEPHVR